MRDRPVLLCWLGILIALVGYALTLLALATLVVEDRAQPFVVFLAASAPATGWAGYDLYAGLERARVTAVVGAIPFFGVFVDEWFRSGQCSVVPLAIGLLIALTPNAFYRRAFRAKSDLIEVFR